jgi:hypothetical protein
MSKLRARRYNPEDSHLRPHRRENLRSYKIFVDCNATIIFHCSSIADESEELLKLWDAMEVEIRVHMQQYESQTIRNKQPERYWLCLFWKNKYHARTHTHARAHTQENGSRSSAVSIVIDCGLDDRDSIPGRGIGFFF